MLTNKQMYVHQPLSIHTSNKVQLIWLFNKCVVLKGVQKKQNKIK